MKNMPENVEEFLNGNRIAVAGVSRKNDVAANAVLKKLKDGGYDVIPINPNASEIDGLTCFPDLRSVPGIIDGVVIATHPEVSNDIAHQCGECGISNVWFHRSFGQGSVSEDAIDTCKGYGIEPVVGGCPLMFSEPVDIIHKCMKWWLQKKGKVPVCVKTNSLDS